MNSKRLLLHCECQGHMMEVVYLPKDKWFEFSYWTLGRVTESLSWKERFRWCWKILRTGNPWSDFIMLNKEKARELQAFLAAETDSSNEALWDANRRLFEQVGELQAKLQKQIQIDSGQV